MPQGLYFKKIITAPDILPELFQVEVFHYAYTVFTLQTRPKFNSSIISAIVLIFDLMGSPTKLKLARGWFI